MVVFDDMRDLYEVQTCGCSDAGCALRNREQWSKCRASAKRGRGQPEDIKLEARKKQKGEGDYSG